MGPAVLEVCTAGDACAGVLESPGETCATADGPEADAGVATFVFSGTLCALETPDAVAADAADAAASEAEFAKNLAGLGCEADAVSGTTSPLDKVFEPIGSASTDCDGAPDTRAWEPLSEDGACEGLAMTCPSDNVREAGSDAAEAEPVRAGFATTCPFDNVTDAGFELTDAKGVMAGLATTLPSDCVIDAGNDAILLSAVSAGLATTSPFDSVIEAGSDAMLFRAVMSGFATTEPLASVTEGEMLSRFFSALAKTPDGRIPSETAEESRPLGFGLAFLMACPDTEPVSRGTMTPSLPVVSDATTSGSDVSFSTADLAEPSGKEPELTTSGNFSTSLWALSNSEAAFDCSGFARKTPLLVIEAGMLFKLFARSLTTDEPIDLEFTTSLFTSSPSDEVS